MNWNRRGAALYSAALVMLSASIWFLAARVEAQAPAPFEIQGQVSNGTHDAPANSLNALPVTLFQVGPQGPVERTVNTDAQGRFYFTDVITDANAYFARVQYGGIKYYSEIAPATLAATAPLTVTIYETQTLPANFTLDRIHLILDVQPKIFNGLQFLQVRNPTDRAFLLQLPLPEKYKDAQFEDVRDQGRAQRLADGAILFPVLPTTTDILYGVTLPFTPPNYSLAMPLPYDVNGVNLLVSKMSGIAVSGDGLTPGNPFTSQNGQQYLVYAAPPQKAGMVFAAEISNLPGADNTQNLQTLIFVAGGLGGLALLAYPVYRRRATILQPRETYDRATLTQAIARLDDAYARDEIEESAYQAQRAAFKAELFKDVILQVGTDESSADT